MNVYSDGDDLGKSNATLFDTSRSDRLEEQDAEGDTESPQSTDSEEFSEDGGEDSQFDSSEHHDVPHGASAEMEIEGDFEYVWIFLFLLCLIADESSADSRLVENIRLTDGVSHSGMLGKVWDLSIEENEAEFRDDLRAASGIGRKRKKVNVMSGSTAHNSLTMTYSGNSSHRSRFIVSSSESYWRRQCSLCRQQPPRNDSNYARGHPNRTSRRVCVVSSGTVLRRPARTTKGASTTDHGSTPEPRCRRVGSTSAAVQVRNNKTSFLIALTLHSYNCRELGFIQQALYCYRKLSTLDPTNVDALWDRASLAKESGDLRTVSHPSHQSNNLSNKNSRLFLLHPSGSTFPPCHSQTLSA